MPSQIWSPERIRSALLEVQPELQAAEIDLADVPEPLLPIIEYARWWGALKEEAERNELIERAGQDAVENLRDVVRSYEDQMLKWLAGPAADDRQPNRAYLAFSDLLQAGAYARLILKSR